MSNSVHSPDLGEYRERARDWLRRATIPTVPLDLDGRFRVLRDWQRTLHEAGWVGITWSRDAGGQALSPWHQLAFSEELTRAGAPQPIGLIGLDVVGPSIDKFGTDQQRRTLLPRLLSGADIWCQGFSEPDAGSDLASLSTRAVPDGDDFVVDGQKVWTSWAPYAQWCALLVRTGDTGSRHRGISYLLVDMSSPGISVRPLVQMTGDTEFGEVFFDSVRVPRANLVGEVDGGWPIAQDTLSTERGWYTLRRQIEFSVGVQDAAAELCGHYEQAGASPSARVAAGLGRAAVAARALEAQTRRTIDRLVTSPGPNPMDSVDKLTVNELEQRIFASLVDLVGPGRTTTTAVRGLDTSRWTKEHYYSRAASIYGGTSQIQRTIIAERMLGLPRG
ncbi:acyl-CoA dehydrogenase family protein [Pseudonocardia ailaonensis]|uniref:Acyl-CoA dehydrogenase family protein n=1 Tax=Pseudonocardia ailaonensis TaxID=367279 RepID=A0ABN2MIM4_9PSEU